MPLETVVAGVMLVALIVYTLTGGADFGGGVWDLLATGPRKRAQRHLIAETLAPIWEANHVWLILIVVLLFVCFPSAFAALSTALHVPLTLMLIGVVLRGSAFVFRAYDPATPDKAEGGWRLVFASTSAITPMMLGVCLGAVASGNITMVDGQVRTDFISEWAAPFPFAIGGFFLAITAMLAATYLTLETEDPGLQEDFRRRAMAARVAVAVMAWVALGLAREGAPTLFEALLSSSWALPFQALTGTIGFGALVALYLRRYALARALVGAEVVMVISGFGGAWYPWLLGPSLTFADAAAPDVILAPVLGALAAGSLLLLPAFVWLYRVFRRSPG
ncbi:MAG: cytochrome d ubiquinol oxidase subunit II [Alphaproteobacteria bacterium]|nr:cytochrome d ubiquinol oxidase subunit II [Alphaproteobacteria bacterium]MCB9797825.1 cytochrome d ubiquinol oxidase subunit II [Alphaproteobacteria bacterium]